MTTRSGLFYSVMRYAVYLLLVTFFLTAVNISHASSTIALLIFLMGIVFAFNSELRAEIDDSIYLFAVIAIVYLSIAVISWYLGGQSIQGLRELGRYIRYLIILSTALLLVKFQFQENFFWLVLVVAAWATGMFAIYQIHIVDDIWRAQGATGAISFGNYCTILAFCSLLVVLKYLTDNSIYIFIAFLGFILAIAGCFLSGSRGAWLAWPVLFLFVVWLSWPVLNLRSKIIFYGLFPITIVLGLVFCPDSYISSGISSVYVNFVSYHSEGNLTSSEAARIQMWRAAIAAFVEHPVFGIGLGNYPEYVGARVEAGLTIEAVKDFSHPHNEYLFVLATRGLVGMVSLLLLFGHPFYYFISRIDRRKLRFCSVEIAGVSVVIVFMVASLTEAILARSIMISVYVVLITILLYFSSSNKDINDKNGSFKLKDT